VEVEDGSIELGYVIHPDFQGKGYMTQALKLAMEELFHMQYRQVITGAFTENTASIRVMEKSGMTRMEKIDKIDYRGKVHTCIYYAKKYEE
jgi:RimJ/RimL family protein N-acetyltransferase